MDLSLEKQHPAKPEPLRVFAKVGESLPQSVAHAAVRPSIQAATTVREYASRTLGEISINSLVEDLERHCEAVHDGDLKQAEALLTVQAQTLDSIFNQLARRANTSEWLPHFEPQMALEHVRTIHARLARKAPCPSHFRQAAAYVRPPCLPRPTGRAGAMLRGFLRRYHAHPQRRTVALPKALRSAEIRASGAARCNEEAAAL